MAAEAVVSFAVETTLTKLVSTIANEVSLVWGLEGDIKTMGDKLKTILNLLKDADKQHEKGDTMKSWIQKLKNAAYDAEDVWDEYAFEMLRRSLEIQICVKACNFFSVSKNPFVFRDRMARRVKDANLMLTGLVNEGKDLGLNQALQEVSQKIHTKFPPTQPNIDDSNILGRKADIRKVVDMLLQSSESDEKLSVVSVVGLGGLGKTTLAQLVYKDPSVTSHFSQFMWICVSNDFSVTRILKEMLEYFKIYETSNLGGLIKELEKELSGNKYLLVLDDVWNTDEAKWLCLRNSLLGIGATKESRILVTTRNVEVASTMTKTLLTHHLPVLSDDDSWTVFRQRAFATGGAANETPYLVGIARKMSKRCGGVPLALNTLGAMMYYKKEHEWSSMWRSFSWDVERGIMPTLQLSFNNLPSPCLKQCFAYCSVFPKDFIFEKDDLIQLWIAQGFIPTSEGSATVMEDIGNKYFKILLWNSFFQDVEMDKYGNIKTCKMHDLMHDLAQALSKSECLILDANDPNVSIKVRHLALAENIEIMPVIVEEHVTKLRTFFSASTGCEDILLKFKFLHTLKLVGDNIYKLPAIIGKLKQLRYLDVSKTEIDVYPACIAKLYNLQTLRLTNFHKSVELMEKFNTLIRLRHLYFDSKGASLMPIAMGKLICLQTLTCFVVGEDQGRRISELGSLSNLGGKLDIRNLEYVSDKEEAKKANLTGKTKVYKLKLNWSRERREGDNNNDEDVLEGLQPPPNLQSLTIENFSGRNFPSWIMISNLSYSGNSLLPQSLVSLTLFECNNCEQIPTLGELPFLQFLEIHGMANVKYIGKEFYSYSNGGDGGTMNRPWFPTLKSLGFYNMHNLVEWREAAAAMTSTASSASERGYAIVVFPCLEELTIYKCKRLQTAPSHFPSLRILNIDGIESGAPIVIIGSKMSILTHLDVQNIPEDVLEGLQPQPNLQSLTIENFLGRNFPSWMLISNINSLLPQNLVSLKLIGCINCEQIPTLGELPFLQLLEIDDMVNVKYIGKEFYSYRIGGDDSTKNSTLFPKLKKLYFQNMHSLVEWSDAASVSTTSTTSSSSSEREGAIVVFPCLEELTIYKCERLQTAPSHFPSLLKLNIYRIESGAPIVNIGSTMSTLTHLDIRNIPDLGLLLQNNKDLTSLKMYDCEMLVISPDGLRNLVSLEFLTIVGCPNLTSSMVSIQGLTSLKELTIESCDGMTSLPIGLGSCAYLEKLEVVGCANLVSVAEEDLRELKSLHSFSIRDCVNLKSLRFERFLHCLPRLQDLEIGDFSDDLDSFPFTINVDYIQQLPQLQALILFGWPKLKSLPRRHSTLYDSTFSVFIWL